MAATESHCFATSSTTPRRHRPERRWAALLRRLLRHGPLARRARPLRHDGASATQACGHGQVARLVAGILGLGAAGMAGAVTLAPDRAEAMYHHYSGGGVTASGPALLVRKGLSDTLALNGSYYVDAVSNASIDVVTTASPFKETRTAYDVGVDYVHRDAQMSFSVASSDEPDYKASSYSLDVAQEVFGGMTTVSLGFSRGSDKVGQKGVGFFDTARHWQYRLGVTQVLSPRWLVSANVEVVADDGYLGSPYRAARVFGGAVPERNPRTRSSRAIKFRSIHAIGEQASWRAEYRYFWDNWAIAAHTFETGFARNLNSEWLIDGSLRLHTQSAALFYSDNADTQTTYVSRNRQLSDFNVFSFAMKATWTLPYASLARYGTKLTGGYEMKRFRYDNYTDLRTGNPYGFNAQLLQLTLTATF